MASYNRNTARGNDGGNKGMFSKLTTKINGALDGMFRKKTITKSDVDMAMYKVRIALLEADVANAVVKQFVKQVGEDCVGSKIENLEEGTSKADYVHARVLERMRILLGRDRFPFLPELLGETDAPLNAMGNENDEKQETSTANAFAPAATTLQRVLVSGIQGSGKTTTCAKLAYRLHNVHGKKVLAVSLDVRRPAAQEQLEIMCSKAGVDCISRDASAKDPVEIARAAIERATREGYDVLILDSAGRLHVDKELMKEMKDVNEVVQAHETMLVADAMTGQDAVKIASQFHNSLSVSGICLTRMDGDARGGAAISMRAVTGIPIKFIGFGEGIKDLDRFDPKRMASRILGDSDFAGVAEKILETANQKDTSKVKASTANLLRGAFSFEDYLVQLEQLDKLGSGWMSNLPSMMGMGSKMDMSSFTELIPLHTKLINAMKEDERKNPVLLKTSSARRQRIASAAGASVADVNKLLKTHEKLRGVSGSMNKSMGGELEEMMKAKDSDGAMQSMSKMKEVMEGMMKNRKG